MLPNQNNILTFVDMERLRQFLMSRPAISLAPLAKAIGTHRQTLTSWKNGKIPLPEKFIEPLATELSRYGLDDFEIAD